VLAEFPDHFVNRRLFRGAVTTEGTHGKDLTSVVDESLVTTGRVVLVDDQLRNRTGDQGFYHIPPFTRWRCFDFELPKLCAWSVWWCLKHDAGKV
jgi:hypothetical protein